MPTNPNMEQLLSELSDPLIADLAGLVASPGNALKEKTFDQFFRVDGPIGSCFVVRSSLGIRNVFLASEFEDDDEFFATSYGSRFSRPLLEGTNTSSKLADALVQGKSKDIVIDLSSMTPFEQSVLRLTQEIPRGEVRPYAWIANGIGSPRAVRAAGTALGHNPVPFLIPCHRVVKSDGDIGSYLFGSPSKGSMLADEGVPIVGTSSLGPLRARFIASDTTKIVCYPTCHSARRITDAHRVTFASLSKAIEGGFRPCNNCRPV